MSEQTAITERQRVESTTIVEAREIAARLKYMMVNGQKLQDHEVFALAHYAAANGLNPFANECYYLPSVGPIPGIAGWRKKAQEAIMWEAQECGIKDAPGFWTETREAFPGEGNFDPDKDIAIFVTLHDSITSHRWRREYFDAARELKELGEEKYFEVAKIMVGPEPVWTGVGVVYGTESFARDGKPEKFDRYERAAKRGEKIALRKRFPRVNLPEPDGADLDDDVIDTIFSDLPEPPKRTEAEIMGDLGFTSETPAQPVASESPAAETVTEDQPVQPVTYTGPQAKIGRNRYPATWARELMPQLAEWEINGFHLDGILQKLALPQDTTAKAAVTAVQAYLDEKEAQS